MSERLFSKWKCYSNSKFICRKRISTHLQMKFYKWFLLRFKQTSHRRVPIYMYCKIHAKDIEVSRKEISNENRTEISKWYLNSNLDIYGRFWLYASLLVRISLLVIFWCTEVRRLPLDSFVILRRRQIPIGNQEVTFACCWVIYWDLVNQPT